MPHERRDGSESGDLLRLHRATRGTTMPMRRMHETATTLRKRPGGAEMSYIEREMSEGEHVVLLGR